MNEEKALEKRDEIKQGYDDLKKELAEFTGTVIMLHHFYQNSSCRLSDFRCLKVHVLSLGADTRDLHVR